MGGVGQRLPFAHPPGSRCCPAPTERKERAETSVMGARTPPLGWLPGPTLPVCTLRGSAHLPVAPAHMSSGRTAGWALRSASLWASLQDHSCQGL
uniref:Alternative protein C9orf69 n=1 Tax=Homo sapiens TaxID=9606 RepID=L0R831_HUMAN|nr:alternative protein C9orf69 [Homo sapiens]